MREMNFNFKSLIADFVDKDASKRHMNFLFVNQYISNNEFQRIIKIIKSLAMLGIIIGGNKYNLIVIFYSCLF